MGRRPGTLTRLVSSDQRVKYALSASTAPLWSALRSQRKASCYTPGRGARLWSRGEFL